MRSCPFLLLALLGMMGVAGCMGAKTSNPDPTPSVAATPTPSSSTPDSMCSQPGMADMCGGTSGAHKKLETKVLQFPPPNTMSNTPVTTVTLDSNVQSISVRVWVNATSASKPYAIAGPGTPPSDPDLLLKPSGGSSKTIALTGCNGLAGSSATGPLKTYTSSVDSAVASSYTLSLTGNGQNAEVDVQITETFAPM